MEKATQVEKFFLESHAYDKMGTAKVRIWLFGHWLSQLLNLYFWRGCRHSRNRICIDNNQTSKSYEWHHWQFICYLRKTKSVLSYIIHLGLIHCKIVLIYSLSVDYLLYARDYARQWTRLTCILTWWILHLAGELESNSDLYLPGLLMFARGSIDWKQRRTNWVGLFWGWRNRKLNLKHILQNDLIFPHKYLYILSLLYEVFSFSFLLEMIKAKSFYFFLSQF